MKKPREILRDMSGTTLALTSLALLGAAAVVTTPMWVWYRRKRKRTDALVSTPPTDSGTARAPADTASERSPDSPTAAGGDAPVP